MLMYFKAIYQIINSKMYSIFYVGKRPFILFFYLFLLKKIFFLELEILGLPRKRSALPTGKGK